MNSINIPTDPHETALKPASDMHTYFGHVVRADARYVILVRGEGKRDFNEAVDPPHMRRTNIEIVIDPIPDMSLAFLLTRESIAESKEGQVTAESLRVLGITSLREIDGKWGKVELVATGRQFTTASGDVRDATSLKFLKFYDTERACVSAFRSERGLPIDDQSATDVTFQHAGQSDPSDNRDREAALAFLKIIVAQTNGDRRAIASQIQAIPTISKYFTIDSPEVASLLNDTNGD